MAATNTGKKIFANLEQIYVDTGVATGMSNKSNNPNDFDYVPPVIDLVTCPITAPVVSTFNKIAISFVNNTDEVVVLSNVIVRAEANVDLSQAYYDGSVSILPHTTFNVPNDPLPNQIDSLTRLLFTVAALSFHQRVDVDIEYKKHSDANSSSVYTTNVGINDVVNVPLATAIESGTNTNTLQIVFS